MRYAAAAGALALTLVTAAAMQPASAEEEVRWRASGSFPAGHSTALAMEIFKSEVARLSDGTIRVDLFPGNTLGGGFEQVDQLRTGQIQMAWGGVSYYDRLVPDLAASVLPFSASSSAQAICQIDSDFGAYLKDKAAEKGIVLLGFGLTGARHVTNNKQPIKTVKDLEGLKIRTPSGEAWMLTFNAVGSNPTPIDIKELYQALQQGVVDGQENPYDNMLVRKFHEVQKYLSNTGHFYDWTAYMVNKEAYDALSDKQRAAVDEAMFTAIAAQRAIYDRADATARQGLIDGGMEYYEIPPAELAKFREATKPVYQQVRAKVGDATMDLAEAAIAACD
ncbi:MAG: TRAP transporter substrate-binding protein [Sneathiellaceae bacterium]